jgi:glutamyl-tRNA(Gln) amidotransferase subunit E
MKIFVENYLFGRALMSKNNYPEIGLKIGIEIHQQLKGTKLYCRCPTNMTIARDFSVKRKMRLSKGEMGKVDAAAAQEIAKDKKFLYTGSIDHNCLVDLDESPPQPISQSALRTVLQVTKIVGATCVDVAQVMRKLIVNGSTTSGFQRTTLIAGGGILHSSEGQVRIPTIIIEEDSAQKLESSNTEVEYSLDRLGIPLIEMTTEPDIRTPEQAKEVAEKIGMILRSTGGVRRGLGTIRQDVNISIAGGARIEIKGAQDLRMIPEYVRQEIKRQQELIALKKMYTTLKIKPCKPVDVSALFAGSTSKVLRSALDTGGVVLAMKIESISGLLGHELQTKRRLGTELANYAKVKDGVRGLFHSDELPAYGVTQSEVNSLKSHLNCGRKDGFVMVAAESWRARRAMTTITARLEQIKKGVPKEVRNALPTGATEYLRPLPGAARMYPETDIPFIPLPKELIDGIEIPELISDKVHRFIALGLSRDLATLVAKSESADHFEADVKKFKKLKPSYIAELRFGVAKQVKKAHKVDINPSNEDFTELFKALAKDKIAKDSILSILKECKPIKSIIKNFYVLEEKEVRAEIKKILKANKDAPTNQLMGKVMGALRGKAPGKLISSIVRELLQK